MRARSLLLSGLAILAGSILPSSAQANERPDGGVRVAARSKGVLDPDGIPTLAPFAHVVFCKSAPADCQVGRGPDRIEATPTLTQTLQAVNRRVNRSIRPVEDPSGPLGDVWRIAPAAGDCDDYAVTKRHELIKLGFPAAALRLLLVRTPSGEGHAVLAVRTDRGDLVLDNLTERVLEWRETRLTLVKYQSGANPQRWLRPGNGMLAMATNDQVRPH